VVNLEGKVHGRKIGSGEYMSISRVRSTCGIVRKSGGVVKESCALIFRGEAH